MNSFGKSAAVLFLAALALPFGARAAESNTHTMTGAVSVTVVAPSRIMATKDLRFGNMMAPTSAGTVVVQPSGTVTTTGGMVGADAVPQPGTGRGPAQFLLNGARSRSFLVFLPNRITLSSPTSSMEARTFTANAGPGPAQFNASGFYTLNVGATLRVNPNQPSGSYAGTFQVTVLYQ